MYWQFKGRNVPTQMKIVVVKQGVGTKAGMQGEVRTWYKKSRNRLEDLRGAYD